MGALAQMLAQACGWRDARVAWHPERSECGLRG